MKFTVVTLLPELVEGAFAAGVVGRARAADVITVNTVNPREFTTDKHRTVDDTPYGGGPGMVMKAEPLLAAIKAAQDGANQRTLGSGASTQPNSHRIALTPSGRPLTQAKVQSLAAKPHLVLICGRYEGIDQRVLDWAVDEEISIGDYVLSGGELAALVIIDAVARLIPGVLGELASTQDESFSHGLLEYPQYTRPQSLPAPDDLAIASSEVPSILSSGNHAAISNWRTQQSMIRTAVRRPDLWHAFRPNQRDKVLLAGLPQLALAARTYVALLHPVVDRTGAVGPTALTNLDLLDIARSTATYGLAGCFFVSPLDSQSDKAALIASIWEDQAQAKVLLAASVQEAMGAIEHQHQLPVRVVASSADGNEFPNIERCDSNSLRQTGMQDCRPLLLLFGTEWAEYGANKKTLGIGDWSEQTTAPELVMRLTHRMHLALGPTVRSAVATTLDRLYGSEVPQLQ